MSLSSYTEPVQTEGDRYKPIDNLGHVVIVRVNEYKASIITANSPEGGPGVVVDLVDLDQEGRVFKDVLWMSGAVVDGLKASVGQDPVMITFEARKSKTGRRYPAPAALDQVAARRANTWWAEHGDTAFDAAVVEDDDEIPF